MRGSLLWGQVRQSAFFFENAHNPQPCPDKRLGKDLRNGHLVRDALSFSKKLVHPIGAIKLCLCHYNLTRAAA